MNAQQKSRVDTKRMTIIGTHAMFKAVRELAIF